MIFNKIGLDIMGRLPVVVNGSAFFLMLVLCGCTTDPSGSNVRGGKSAHTQQVRIISETHNYKVEEISVKGRPEIGTDEIRPALRIDSFSSEGISSNVQREMLRKKLDPQKSYFFYLLATFQKSGEEHVNNRTVTLSKVTENDDVIIDASYCAIHHCRMEFKKEAGCDWETSKRDRNAINKICPNHGYDISACGSPWYFWTWRCPKCAKAFTALKKSS